MTSFDGQVVIVTGAAAGIGLGIARAFHDAGASVVLGDVQQDALDRARARFSDLERLAFVPVDVRDAAAVAHLVATAEQVFGPPTIMIANAGVVPNASVLSMDVTAWDAAIETNLRGVFLSCQAAARSMVAHGTQGRIVTVSSIASHVGRLGASAYCASKAGVEIFTKVLAMELAEHRINVSAVAPGVVEIPERAAQPSTRRMNEEFRAALIEAIPLDRYGRVEEVAQAVLFLCSPGAAYITGAVVPIDGGMDTGWTHMPYSSI
ncbi:MAG: SDR family oxidoreductase [Chloroflexi bacterium]|nr:SDR family oxidoreductase [Chloroflexota bacterium]